MFDYCRFFHFTSPLFIIYSLIFFLLLFSRFSRRTFVIYKYKGRCFFAAAAFNSPWKSSDILKLKILTPFKLISPNWFWKPYNKNWEICQDVFVVFLIFFVNGIKLSLLSFAFIVLTPLPDPDEAGVCTSYWWMVGWCRSPYYLS